MEKSKSATLILVRHASTDWNAGQFMTGWANPALNAEGREEAYRVGVKLRAHGFVPEHVVTSRSDRTVQTALEILHVLGVPIELNTTWQLNERHLGALQGLDRAAATLIYGRDKFRQWKRQPDATPPEIEVDDLRHPRHDPLYDDVDPRRLPSGESQNQMKQRLLEGWTSGIEPLLTSGATVLVVGHCHSLRALVTLIEGSPSRAPDSFSSPGDAMIYVRRGETWQHVPEYPSVTR